MKTFASVTTLALMLSGWLVLGCGGDSSPADPPKPPPREAFTPELRQVAPTAISAGQTLTIMGAGFEDGTIGQTRVLFDGIYQTTAGATYTVKLDIVPKYTNQGMVTWLFGPNIPFIPTGKSQDTGVFRGRVFVRNVALRGGVKSDPFKSVKSVQIQVLASIIIRNLRPRDVNCGVGLTDTTADTKVLFEMEAIGLKAGNSTAPLRFIYTFMKQHFQFRGYFANQVGMDPESLFPKTGPTSAVDDVTDGRISKLGTGVPRNIYVAKSANTNTLANATFGADKTFGLTDLYTAPMSSPANNSYTANMNVVAIDSAGQKAARSLQIKVWSPVEVSYTGGSTVVEIFDPVPVSGCIAGGSIGRDVTYTEAEEDKRIRTYKVNTTVSVGADIKVIKLNAAFGMEVGSEVSSAKSKDLKITATILPGEYAVFYRQTIKLERKAKLVGHGGCGSTQDLGDVVVTDWTWSPDLAKGNKCPPLPKSNLPSAKKYTKTN